MADFESWPVFFQDFSVHTFWCGLVLKACMRYESGKHMYMRFISIFSQALGKSTCMCTSPLACTCIWCIKCILGTKKLLKVEETMWCRVWQRSLYIEVIMWKVTLWSTRH